MAGADNWEHSNIQAFWGELTPCEHLVQVYENEKVFIDTLEGFAGTGFLAGDSIVIIATAAHLHELNERLVEQGFDLELLQKDDQYIPLEANKILSKFMINELPDENAFNEAIMPILERAGKNGRNIRAFGEMVVILWSTGNREGTIQLENLWNQLQQKESFTLFCAYPNESFAQNANDIHTICQTHSKLIDGGAHPATEIYYKALDPPAAAAK